MNYHSLGPFKKNFEPKTSAYYHLLVTHPDADQSSVSKKNWRGVGRSQASPIRYGQQFLAGDEHLMAKHRALSQSKPKTVAFTFSKSAHLETALHRQST
jgi:hypothetical protein